MMQAGAPSDPRTLAPSHRRTLAPSHLGFTLLELVVVIAVIGILAAAVAPSVIQQIMGSRVDGTRSEAEAIARAITGDPAQNQFGFAGDIGRLPATLDELASPGGLPAYTTATVRSIGMGWRGPYINAGGSASDFLTDGFGRAYTLSSGQVRSAGTDGIANNADDIVYPPSEPGITGDVTVTVKNLVGARVFVDPAGYRVDLYYPSNGAQAFLSDATPPFSFSNVPQGPRALRVVKTSTPNAGSVVAEDTIVVRPGSSVAAELWF
jgi:prepilin-type N-terminal cleavage/methylation domain-containing protein